MNTYRTSSVLALAVLLAVAASSSAYDVNGGDIWFRGMENSTFQHWMFSSPTQMTPEVYTNPYGEPTATLQGDGVEWSDEWPCPPELDPTGDVPGWHSPLGGTAIFLLHNDPTPREKKLIVVQVTSSKEPLSISLDLPPGITFEEVDLGLNKLVQWGLPAPFDGSWATYTYCFETSLNPEWESIQIDYPPCTTLDQIVVDTICIPEPVTACMLALGLVCLRRRR